MNSLVIACFAVPLALTAKSVIQDNIFMARSHQKQIEAKTWKQRNGKLIELTKMEDEHLANTIRMVARNCHRESYLGDMRQDKSFIKLVNEAKRRKFQITLLNHPTVVDGRKEYVD